jgi:hypothetical protein
MERVLYVKGALQGLIEPFCVCPRSIAGAQRRRDKRSVPMRLMLTSLAVLSLVASPVALAAPCKDAKGRFMKCPPKKAVHCKLKDGKFAKCGTPGAKPA